MKTQIAIAQNLIFRRTASHKGRHLAVTPNNSAMRHLSYGRIIVDAGMASVRFATGERETGLICLSGHGIVAVGGDRKSTRLNSSHSQISYAVFCFKKKKQKINRQS